MEITKNIEIKPPTPAGSWPQWQETDFSWVGDPGVGTPSGTATFIFPNGQLVMRLSSFSEAHAMSQLFSGARNKWKEDHGNRLIAVVTNAAQKLQNSFSTGIETF